MTLHLHIFFFHFILCELFQHSNQECAAYTGNIIPNPIIDSFIIAPKLYYSSIGKQVVDNIRNQICSTSEDKLLDLFATPRLRNIPENFLTGSIFSCYVAKKYNNTLSLGGMRDELCQYFDSIEQEQVMRNILKNYDSDCIYNGEYFIPSQDYVINRLVSQYISDYKSLIKSRYKMEEIVSMIQDYCQPLNIDEDYSLSYSNGGMRFDGDDERNKGVKIAPYLNVDKILQCINSKITDSQVSKIEELCRKTDHIVDQSFWHILRYGLIERNIRVKHTSMWPLPSPEDVNSWYDAMKNCIDNEPYVYDDSRIKLPGKNDWMEMFHNEMCLMNDPMKISYYFNCFDYKSNYSHSFHDDFMQCLRLLDINPMIKQSIACYKGWIYPDGLEKIDDIDIRREVSKCLESRDSIGCSFSKGYRIISSEPSFHSEPKECLRSAVSYSDIFSNLESYEIVLNETDESNRKLCTYRYLHLVSTFTNHFKNASDCFSAGPKDGDTEVKYCYKKIFDSLTIHYDKDFILCDLHAGTIRKVSHQLAH